MYLKRIWKFTNDGFNIEHQKLKLKMLMEMTKQNCMFTSRKRELLNGFYITVLLLRKITGPYSNRLTYVCCQILIGHLHKTFLFQL